jgi:hypothetical protein
MLQSGHPREAFAAVKRAAGLRMQVRKIEISADEMLVLAYDPDMPDWCYAAGNRGHPGHWYSGQGVKEQSWRVSYWTIFGRDWYPRQRPDCRRHHPAERRSRIRSKTRRFHRASGTVAQGRSRPRYPERRLSAAPGRGYPRVVDLRAPRRSPAGVLAGIRPTPADAGLRRSARSVVFRHGYRRVNAIPSIRLSSRELKTFLPGRSRIPRPSTPSRAPAPRTDRSSICSCSRCECSRRAGTRS